MIAAHRTEPVATLKDPPWGRQRGESAPAFRAFCVFRDMGGLDYFHRWWSWRTVDEVGRTLYPGAARKRGRTGCLRRWYRRWRWRERAIAYDAWREERERERRPAEVPDPPPRARRHHGKQA